MYYKFARTLSSENKYQINIIGFPSKGETIDANVGFHPLPYFRRKSGGRWKARITAARTIWNLRPNILIVCTHELLSTALLCRFFLGSVIIYDVRENYKSNLAHRKNLLATFAGWMVRLKETVASVFMDYHILAERSYREELPFVKRKNVIIQNSALTPEQLPELPVKFKDPPTRFLFTGTLAKQTGIFTAIDMIEQVRTCIPNAQLTIVGNCMDELEFKRIQSQVNQKDWIYAEIDKRPIPYSKILKAITHADVGIVAYETHEFLSDKVPTKLFEYVANCLPILFSSNNNWSEMTKTMPAGLCWDEPDILCKNLHHNHYFQTPPNDDWYWKNDSINLLELINTFQ